MVTFAHLPGRLVGEVPKTRELLWMLSAPPSSSPPCSFSATFAGDSSIGPRKCPCTCAELKPVDTGRPRSCQFARNRRQVGCATGPQQLYCLRLVPATSGLSVMATLATFLCWVSRRAFDADDWCGHVGIRNDALLARAQAVSQGSPCHSVSAMPNPSAARAMVERAHRRRCKKGPSELSAIDDALCYVANGLA